MFSFLGCNFFTGTDREEYPGWLAHFGDTAEVSVPATVVVGEELTASVSTFAGGCGRKERTETERMDGLVVIRPIDSRSTSDDSCPQILLRFEHSVTVTPETVGPLTIRAIGSSRDDSPPSEVILEEEVTVEPSS